MVTLRRPITREELSMRVLVACEFSGVVRDAFAALGHDAWSCDLLPSETEGNHIEGNVLGWLVGAPKRYAREEDPFEHPLFGIPVAHFIPDITKPWDLLIAHPPCTHLSVSGARWFKDKQAEQFKAIQFAKDLWNAPIPRICLENPISILSTHIRKPDQIIQPWQFGHGEIKATCLWLKGLPNLIPTNIVDGRTARVHREPPSPERWKNRSRTLIGIAQAMAQQWGNPAPTLDTIVTNP